MNREVPLLLACLALPALAQQVRFEVPRLGYVYDAEAKAVRAVSGVPGAAVLEGTVSQGSLDRAWVSSLGFAVAQAKQGGSARLLNFETGTDTVLGDVQSAALSGRFAAVANRSSLEIWDAQSASRTTRLDLSGVRAVAVSPDGQQALATNGTTLQRIAGDTATSIWSGDNIIGVAYIDGGYVAFDAARNKLLIARGGETSETDGPLTGATAFAALDGTKLAFGNDTAIAVLDLASSTVRSLATEHPVEELLASNNGVAQIRFRGSSRVALLEWNADQSTAQIEYLVVAGGAR
ncbi:hypothetical protein F183_A42080 [Bryobacterales bacterium F-183]|nr:hypothetical protein F183_A42080 [Bryobacterales bacterium F-183]